MKDHSLTYEDGARAVPVAEVSDEDLDYAIENIGKLTQRDSDTARDAMLDRLRIEKLIRAKGWR